MLPFVWGAGGDLFDKTVTDCSDDVLIADIKKNAFTSPFTFQKVDDIMRYFSRNKVAMMMGSAATILSLQKIGGCDFAVAPFPGTAKVPAVKVYKSGSSAEDPFFHDWSFPENGNFGGVFWCRGNSWYVSSIIDFIEIMDQDPDAGVRDFLRVLRRTRRPVIGRLGVAPDRAGAWQRPKRGPYPGVGVTDARGPVSIISPGRTTSRPRRRYNRRARQASPHRRSNTRSAGSRAGWRSFRCPSSEALDGGLRRGLRGRGRS